MPYKTIAEVRAANKATNHFFFSRDTMRFWQTRIHGGLRRGRFFITSDGSIETRGEFQGFRTVEEAREALEGLL